MDNNVPFAPIYGTTAEKAMATHSSTLAWKIPWTDEPGRLQSMGSIRVGHNFTFTFTFHFHALEKEMATHSSILAWRIPGTEEPSGLPSGSHRVGHDWSDLAAAAAAWDYWSFPDGSGVKNSSANAEDTEVDSIPGLGRSPEGEHGNSLQYSCLENPMDRGAWQATVHGVTKSWTWLKRLSTACSMPLLRHLRMLIIIYFVIHYTTFLVRLIFLILYLRITDLPNLLLLSG